ncbi:MAG: prepilin-type N-terminal cleavage/methylation domain-containing protein [Candidatus Saccharimonadaceae bacterium]
MNGLKNTTAIRGAGFTIVELLIVIVVIAVLAAITIVAFNGVRDRANNAKINSDLAQIQKAIQAARINSGEVAARYVTLSTATASPCVGIASNVDLADTVAAAACWTAYNSAMDKISTASNINVRDLKDPWGRPYFLDENEKEGATLCGLGRDNIGAFPQPRTQGSWTITNAKTVPYVTPGC